MTALLIIVALVALILLGLPIAVSMGLVAIVTYFLIGQPEVLTMLPQRMYSSTTGFTLLAVPFFILAGNLMNTGGITHRIFRFSHALVGHWRGGLGQVNIAASLIFSGMSGAAAADAAGLGQVELKAMRDGGYDPKFSAAITAASSTIGPVFPPSIPFVIYGSLTGVSVVKLFLAGVIPGLLMAGTLMVAVGILARLRNYPREAWAGWREIAVGFMGALAPLGAPVIIIGGLLFGWFTPTEAGVVACVYALILGCVVYRELKLADLPAILWDSTKLTVNVMFIIAAAGFFGWLLVHQRIPDELVNSVLSFAETRYAAIALMIVILIVLGMFIEGIAVIVITVPLFMPMVQHFGIDLVQFGVIMILTSMIGLLTPPVGIVLFAVSAISKINVWTLTREIWPYLLAIVAVLILAAIFPAVSTWLPNLVVGGVR